jgi:hypothetical protein
MERIHSNPVRLQSEAAPLGLYSARPESFVLVFCGFLRAVLLPFRKIVALLLGLDTSTPMGKAMFQIAGVFAELERSILKERIMAGIARARDKGPRAGSLSDGHAFRPVSRQPLQGPYSRASTVFIKSRLSTALALTLRSGLRLPCIWSQDRSGRARQADQPARTGRP